MDGNGTVPADFNDLMLMIEWGITYQEYLDTPEVVIQKIREYKMAVADGESRAQKKAKSKST